MGQTLSEPVTEKHTAMLMRDKKLAVAVSDMQGWRISMEDAHSLHLSLPPNPNASSDPASSASEPSSSQKFPEQPPGSTFTNFDGEDGPAFFGVFDGHGGSAVAKFTGTTIHSRLAALEAYKEGDYEKALKTLYLKTDEDLRADPNFLNDPSGCTAVSGLITLDGKIIVANSGDSRAVLGYKGEAKPLSIDHKPTNTGENARITAAGGFVEFGRVNGNLALSRAIGDFEFKQNYSLDAEHQIVTADPEITVHDCDGEEEFLVLACDGIWDCLSSQQVIDFVRRAVANGDSLTKVCEDLIMKCLAPDSELGGIGCDNMTVVIVALLNGRTLEEWQAWVKERVDNKVGYDTPERVADVFGHSNATAMAGPTGGIRSAGAASLANLQQVLANSGIRFATSPASDDDEEDEEDEMEEDPKEKSEEEAAKSAPDGVGADQVLAEFVRNLTRARAPEHEAGSSNQAVDSDGDSQMTDVDSSSETPENQDHDMNSTPTAKDSTTPHASASESSTNPGKPEQLQHHPQGDAPSGSLKAEGLMDKSESPMAM